MRTTKQSRTIWPRAFIQACLFSAVLVGCGPREEPPPEGVRDVPEEPSTRTGQTKAAKPETPAAPAGSLEWPTYHGGPALDGVSKANFPEKLVLRWRFRTGAPVRTTPVAGDGRIYFSDAKGRLTAVDLAGQQVWSKAFTRGTAQDGSPLEEVFDAPLAWFAGALVAGSADGTVYALDAATGEERWKTNLGGTILGTVNYRQAASNDENARLLVIEQGGGALHCLDFRTGAPVWTAEGVARCDGPPSVGNDVVVFGSCAAALHVFSAKDGTLLREIPIDDDSQVASGVAIIGDSVFSGSRSGKVLHANARTGAVLWVNEDSEDEVFSTPAVNSELVVFGSADGVIHALDRATGRRKWDFPTEGQPSSPVIATDKVVAVSDGTLFLLNLSDGAKLWSYEVSDMITSPAIVGDLIVVGCDDGSVAAFGLDQT